MSSLFSPSIPEMKPPPPVPQADKATIDREAQDLAIRRRGRAATVLAGDQPAPAGSVAVKSLLGA
jgi:hypothetical protein